MSLSNHITVIGNVGKVPEQTAVTRDQRPVVRFAVAQDVNGMDANTQKLVRKEPQWFQVSCFAGTAERALGLSKGDLVLVVGELKSRTYLADNGERRNSVELIANEVYRLERLQKQRNALPEQMTGPACETDFATFESMESL